MTIRDATSSYLLTIITGPFGYYRFDGLEVGRSYILRLAAKRFTFPSNPILVTLNDEISELELGR